jgi:oligoribonuclease
MLGIFLDTEASGLNAMKHKVLEIALKVVDVETGEVEGEYQSVISHPFEEWEKSDPNSLRVNGFTWDEVNRGRSIPAVADAIIALFAKLGIKRGSSVFICQNPSFDRPFFGQIIAPEMQEKLLWPYHWLDFASMFWADALKEGKVMPWETGFSKDKIAARFGLPSEVAPHRAMNGVDHLILCYEAVIGYTTDR